MRLITIAICFIGSVAFADSSALVKGLVSLRGELETLNREIESLSKEQQGELDLWLQKKLELEAAVQKEQLRSLHLSEKTRLLAGRVQAEVKADPKSKQLLQAWIERAKAWTKTSLPYRLDDRRRVLTSLSERVERGLESLESIAAELWLFYESEFKMAADNEYRIADLNSEHGTQKAEIVRLGFYSMFARTPDGKIEQAVFENGKWMMKVVKSTAQEEVSRMIDNMKAKKDSGLYALPIVPAKEIL